MMYKYEMDPTRTVGATERTRDAGRMDGQTDGQTDGRSETNIPPTISLCGGIITAKYLWRAAIMLSNLVLYDNSEMS